MVRFGSIFLGQGTHDNTDVGSALGVGPLLLEMSRSLIKDRVPIPDMVNDIMLPIDAKSSSNSIVACCFTHIGDLSPGRL